MECNKTSANQTTEVKEKTYEQILQERINFLERQLKLTEQDRDESKMVYGTLIGSMYKILEMDNIDEIKKEIFSSVKESVKILGIK